MPSEKAGCCTLSNVLQVQVRDSAQTRRSLLLRCSRARGSPRRNVCPLTKQVRFFPSVRYRDQRHEEKEMNIWKWAEASQRNEAGVRGGPFSFFFFYTPIIMITNIIPLWISETAKTQHLECNFRGRFCWSAPKMYFSLLRLVQNTKKKIYVTRYNTGYG